MQNEVQFDHRMVKISQTLLYLSLTHSSRKRVTRGGALYVTPLLDSSLDVVQTVTIAKRVATSEQAIQKVSHGLTRCITRTIP